MRCGAGNYSGLYKLCPECRGKSAARARENQRKASIAWAKRNPEKIRANSRRQALRRKYGITPEDYDEILKDQGGKCALCDGTKSGLKGNRMFVDHDHKTGEVRALLCFRCNLMIGHSRENIQVLRNAITYLETFG